MCTHRVMLHRVMRYMMRRLHCVRHCVTEDCKPCRLEPERGHFPGPPPALLPETDPASLQETMLGADELGLGEMGANQVVLVRSEASNPNP